MYSIVIIKRYMSLYIGFIDISSSKLFLTLYVLEIDDILQYAAHKHISSLKRLLNIFDILLCNYSKPPHYLILHIVWYFKTMFL